jgi:hypothetical protein
LLLLNPQNDCPSEDSTKARYVNLKPPQDSFDLFCLLQGWRGTGFHPTVSQVGATLWYHLNLLTISIDSSN